MPKPAGCKDRRARPHDESLAEIARAADNAGNAALAVHEKILDDGIGDDIDVVGCGDRRDERAKNFVPGCISAGFDDTSALVSGFTP